MKHSVDVVVLSRDGTDLEPAVATAITSQLDTNISLHRVFGRPNERDTHKWQTIARARNQAKILGRSPWLMFVDDDVVLPPNCISTLVRELEDKPVYGALAADYLGESVRGSVADHVSMGATMFRREALNRVTFRASSDRCDCSYCCEDLRKQWIGINYVDGLVATHLELPVEPWHAARPSVTSTSQARPVILTAFNRRDYIRFCNQFLSSLRTSGNEEEVIAVTYGLRPRELKKLESYGVIVHPCPANEHDVARRRMNDFQTAIDRFPAETPVAYWDAGDVLFQASLDELWEIVRENQDKVHVTCEPIGHPHVPGICSWIDGIDDATQRKSVNELLHEKTMYNGGFAAGTVAAMQRFLSEVCTLQESPVLQGAELVDQLAMNVYCHSDSDACVEIDSTWNYCLCNRELGGARFDKNGKYQDGESSRKVLHGNGWEFFRIPGYVENVLSRNQPTLGMGRTQSALNPKSPSS